MKEEKIAIVNNMVAKGYKLMGRDVEWYADNFTLEDLKRFEEKFVKTMGK